MNLSRKEKSCLTPQPLCAWQRIFKMLKQKNSYSRGNQKHCPRTLSISWLMMWLTWWLKIYKKTIYFHRN